MSDSKEHILKTSLQLFLQKSFKEVTMKGIVEKTGLSKGAFYHYFTSKEQVFEEVINHYYSELLLTDFGKFSQESFEDFFHDALKERQFKASTVKVKIHGEALPANHYFLLFDAMKMLPGFKKKRLQHQEEELKAWTVSIRSAKKRGEIKTVMSEDMLAKLFIYSSKGCSISQLSTGDADNSYKEIGKIWEELYKDLKK